MLRKKFRKKTANCEVGTVRKRANHGHLEKRCELTSAHCNCFGLGTAANGPSKMLLVPVTYRLRRRPLPPRGRGPVQRLAHVRQQLLPRLQRRDPRLSRVGG